MNNNYNSNMYLITSDLNTVENQIETLTEEIQENIFNNTTSPLRNIQVGDNLNTKTLYCFFPNNIYQYITSETISNFITTNNNHSLRFFKTIGTNYNKYDIGFSYNGTYTLYRKLSNGNGIFINRIKYKLPHDFGIVTNIDDNNEIYQYIKIYDDETIIPNYVKHTWIDNEFLSMQKIDNIEQGIKNIGEYYYKPQGWLNSREWLKICKTTDFDNNTNIQNISYMDLNRWSTDLSLINFDNLNEMTIWNSIVSEIDWNMENDTDWEEL